MNEEEKKVVNIFIEKCNKYDESVEIKGLSVGEEYRMLNTVCKALNLIEKLQKENEKYKRLAEINLKSAEEFKNNMCEHRCLLKNENEELKSKNKTLEELLQGNLYELYKYYKELAGTYQGNCILVQTVKDKIKELDDESHAEELEDIMIGGNYTITELVQYVLQELIEERSDRNENM